jgi:hypothetical protein
MGIDDLGLQRCKLIKIDVEGAERHAASVQGVWPVEGLDDTFASALRRHGVLRDA